MGDSEVIASVRDQVVNAFNAANIDSLVELETDDTIVMPPNQPPVIGSEAFRSWLKEGFDAANSRFEVSPQELEVAGDWAFDRFNWTMETTPTGGGEATQDNGECVWIWRRQRDGSGLWKLARSIWNSDNEVAGPWTGAPRS